jgi:acetoin utilization deacetylase AcuC-like enzyme
MSMKVVTHSDFHMVYNNEPAAARGRIQAVLDGLGDAAEIIEAVPADPEDIAAVHTKNHIAHVSGIGLHDIAALAAGAAIQAAAAGMKDPCFALVRPPGHHAYADNSWGFCYFNNMAIALEHLKRKGLIETAYVLDFDLHFGDGTVAILKPKGYVAIHNPSAEDRATYLQAVQEHLRAARADIIGVSAGFDNHLMDWGGLLWTEDYKTMGGLVREACLRLGVGCFAILEGGYNHQSMAESAVAFMQGLEGE